MSAPQRIATLADVAVHGASGGGFSCVVDVDGEIWFNGWIRAERRVDAIAIARRTANDAIAEEIDREITRRW